MFIDLKRKMEAKLRKSGMFSLVGRMSLVRSLRIHSASTFYKCAQTGYLTSSKQGNVPESCVDSVNIQFGSSDCHLSATELAMPQRSTAFSL